MSDPRSICVDANLVINMVADPTSPLRSHWQRWDRDGIELVAPSLLPYEVANGLYRTARARLESIESVESLISTAARLPIRYVDAHQLTRRAIRLAHRFSLSATYDAYYLALAESLDTQLWTLDRRLHTTVSPHLPWVILPEALA